MFADFANFASIICQTTDWKRDVVHWYFQSTCGCYALGRKGRIFSCQWGKAVWIWRYFKVLIFYFSLCIWFWISSHSNILYLTWNLELRKILVFFYLHLKRSRMQYQWLKRGWGNLGRFCSLILPWDLPQVLCSNLSTSRLVSHVVHCVFTGHLRNTLKYVIHFTGVGFGVKIAQDIFGRTRNA